MPVSMAVKMRASSEFSTSMSVTELSIIFRDAAESMYGAKEKLARFVRRLESIKYFTPRETPFDALDDDKEKFSVGVTFPKFSGTGGGVVTLHMYVWDRGDVREVELYSPHSLDGSVKARQVINKVLNELRKHDSGLRASPR